MIIDRLRSYKKQFSGERKTELTNITKEKYVEEIKEEALYVVVDRFGYVKSLDKASYSRLSEENLREYTYQIPIMNTDKLCVFTEEGNMHQVKVKDIPKARNRDKGVLIQTLCRVEKENVIF